MYFYWAVLLKSPSQVTKEVRQRERYLGKSGIQPRLVYTVFYGVAISLTSIPWPVSVGYQRSSIHSISPFFRFVTFIL